MSSELNRIFKFPNNWIFIQAAVGPVGATIGNEHGIHPSDLPTHTFELLNESSDFLEHALFFGQVLRMKRAHLGQNGIELSAIVTGEFPF